MYKAILFDLDGTLTESGEGITKSVQYALEKLGRPEEDLSKLECFIGPPLIEQFQKFAGMDLKTAQQAVTYYRERFTTVGIFENAVYPGVEQMLKTLKDKGYRLAVSSSKPEPFVIRIMEHFHLDPYFEEIVGAALDETRTQKDEVVEEALKRMKLSDDRSSVILVGDKEHDVLGARKCGLECLAVSYGYGTKEELLAANPLKIVDSTEEVTGFFA